MGAADQDLLSRLAERLPEGWQLEAVDVVRATVEISYGGDRCVRLRITKGQLDGIVSGAAERWAPVWRGLDDVEAASRELSIMLEESLATRPGGAAVETWYLRNGGFEPGYEPVSRGRR